MIASKKTIHGRRCVLPLLAVGLTVSLVTAGALRAEEKPKSDHSAAKTAKAADAISGREIFVREWLPNDSRSHGGDGLGPVFNDSSCVACHNQGGTGGGGAASKNVNIVSAFVTPQNIASGINPPQASLVTQALRALALQSEPPAFDPKTMGRQKQRTERRKKRLTKRLKKELLEAHPGFGTARSVVLHHFSTNRNYDAWRSKFLQNQFGGFFSGPFSSPSTFTSDVTFETIVDIPQDGEPQSTSTVTRVTVEAAPRRMSRSSRRRQKSAQELNRVRMAALSVSRVVSSTVSHSSGNVQTISSQRNPTALFGVGLIDSISNEVIEAQAKKKHRNRKITGRVSRLKDGKIGRFGWKSQKASLYDFTITACGVELGLNVPDHPQSGHPLKPKYKPVGYDLNQKEVDALVGYLKDLPAPKQRTARTPQETKFLAEGRKAFSAVGCADCHTEKLGAVAGIYSDLLIHDMGDELADTGGYGVFIPESPGGETGEAFPALTDAFVPRRDHMAIAMVRTPSVEAKVDKKIIGATRLEWRTPALWGLRDSGPYMHDGRAQTLEHAIAFHGGEAHNSALDYFALTPLQRQQMIAFLKSLIAPTQLASAK